MNDQTWDTSFRALFERCAQLHRAGDTTGEKWFIEADKAFLSSIGHTAQEFFDFVDDHCRYGEEGPSLETALLIAAVRRDYFNVVMGGKFTGNTISPSELPPKPAAIDGIPWLPRLLSKAKAKLRGEMDPDTMYGCGGDRAFFRAHQIHPADFLRMTWASGGNDRKVIDWVKSRRF